MSLAFRRGCMVCLRYGCGTPVTNGYMSHAIYLRPHALGRHKLKMKHLLLLSIKGISFLVATVLFFILIDLGISVLVFMPTTWVINLIWLIPQPMFTITIVFAGGTIIAIVSILFNVFGMGVEKIQGYLYKISPSRMYAVSITGLSAVLNCLLLIWAYYSANSLEETKWKLYFCIYIIMVIAICVATIRISLEQNQPV